MVVAMLALIVALGGTSYAAVKLPKASVGSRELKKNAVITANIKNSAVTGAKVKSDSLTGADINEATLAPPALAAASNHANAAAGLDRVSYRTAAASVGPATQDPNDSANFLTSLSGPVSAGCDPGQVVTGGGVHIDDPGSLATHESYPSTARTWTAVVGNDDETAPHNFTVYAICVPAGAVG
jgi:hypothetical protein